MVRQQLNEEENAFVKMFSHFVNGRNSSPKRVGGELANEHRYLMEEKFKVAMAFLETSWH